MKWKTLDGDEVAITIDGVKFYPGEITPDGSIVSLFGGVHHTGRITIRRENLARAAAFGWKCEGPADQTAPIVEVSR